MKYVLEDLLRVREFREASRGNEMKAKKMLLDRAEITVKEKEKDLSEHQAWRVDREEALYDEVKGSHIRIKDLEDLKLKVGLMREKEAVLENDVIEAERARESAEEVFMESRDTYHLAVRETKKIEEHKKIWVEEVSREEEQSQDKEMEEFQKTRSNPDWGDEDDEDIRPEPASY